MPGRILEYRRNMATVRIDVPKAGHVVVRVFDVTGREVARLAEGVYPSGEHRIAWNAEKYASGVYLLRMEAEGFRQMRKVVMVK